MPSPSKNENLGRSWYFEFDLVWRVPPAAAGVTWSSYVETTCCMPRGYLLVLLFDKNFNFNCLLKVNGENISYTHSLYFPHFGPPPRTFKEGKKRQTLVICTGGSKEGPGTYTHLFHFMQFSPKNLQHIRLAHPLWELCTLFRQENPGSATGYVALWTK